jgi:hypothetical protein
MPKLPDASQLDRGAPQSRFQAPVDQSGDIIGQALRVAGENAVAAQRERQGRQDRLYRAQAANDLNIADAEERSRFENDPDWATQEDRYTAAMQKRTEGIAKNFRNPDDRALFESEAKVALAAGTLAVRRGAHAREASVGLANLSDQEGRQREIYLTTDDPVLRERAAQSINDLTGAAVDSGYLSPEAAQERFNSWRTDLADGYVDTLSPERQVEELKGPAEGSLLSYLPADRRAVRLKQAQAAVEAKKREAEALRNAQLTEARQAMNDRFRDMQVGAQMGLPVEVPPKSVLTALYGEQEGAQRYQSAQKLAKLSGDVAGLQALPTSDLIAKVDAYEPTRVEGAAEQAQLQQALAGNVRSILEHRAKDPAGYLVQQSPVVGRAWEAMTKDAANAPQYLSAVRAEKERLGIPGDSVLPDSYAASLADEVSSAPAEKMADRIDEEAQRWGDAWPEVYGQIASKLPPMAAVIGSGIPKSAQTALAATANLKDAELKAMLPPGTKWADLESVVADQFEDFARSMPPEAAGTVAATRDAAVRLTLQHMNAGAGRGEAAKRAYRELVGSQYEIRDIGGYAVRIPAGVDSDAIEVGARRKLKEFEPDARSIVVPPGAALTAEEYASRYRAYVRENGYWVTSPNSQGLRLYVDGEPVVTRKGAVDVPWQDFKTMTAPLPGSADDYADFRGPQ